MCKPHELVHPHVLLLVKGDLKQIQYDLQEKASFKKKLEINEPFYYLAFSSKSLLGVENGIANIISI